jgi:hypothetical protein
VIVKSMSYKASTRLWSNAYHFSGGFPSGSSPAITFMDAVVNAEKLALAAGSTITQAKIYPAGSDVASFQKVYTTVGSLSVSGKQYAPGDAAALGRWTTTQVTTKNHPIYLFNYFHHVMTSGPTTPDTLDGTQKTAYETYMTAWLSGFSDGTNTYLRAGPNGAVAQSRSVNPYLTHRDFPT